jgi:hypothetical protein
MNENKNYYSVYEDYYKGILSSVGKRDKTLKDIDVSKVVAPNKVVKELRQKTWNLIKKQQPLWDDDLISKNEAMVYLGVCPKELEDNEKLILEEGWLKND